MGSTQQSWKCMSTCKAEEQVPEALHGGEAQGAPSILHSTALVSISEAC